MKSEAYISFIVDELKTKTQYVEIISVFCAKFRKSKRTFDKYWKIASQRHLEAQQSIQDKKAKDNEASQLANNKVSNLQREKVVEMASNVLKLAYNKVVENSGEDKSVYAFASALEKYNKLEGFDKPTKMAETNPDGSKKVDNEYIIVGRKFANENQN